MQLRVIIVVVTTVLCHWSTCLIVSRPINQVVVVGSKARMQCRTDLPDSVSWYFLSTLPGLSEDIYSGKTFINAVQGRYTIYTGSAGEHTIVIDGVQAHHAGTYICKDNEGLGEQVQAELTVLENEPDCYQTKNATGEYVRCNVTSVGKLQPEMMCNSTVLDRTHRSWNTFTARINNTTDLNSCLFCFRTQSSTCVIFKVKINKQNQSRVMHNDTQDNEEHFLAFRNNSSTTLDRTIVPAIVVPIVIVGLCLLLCVVLVVRRRGQKSPNRNTRSNRVAELPRLLKMTSVIPQPYSKGEFPPNVIDRQLGVK